MPSRRTGLTASIVLPLLFCFAALLQTACAPKAVPEPAWETDARAMLDQAEGQLNKKQYEQASKTVDSFLYRYPTSRSRDRGLYLLGEIRFTLRDYAKALTYYKELIQEFSTSPLLLSARFRLGQCYFELKDYDPAIANLEDRSRISDPVRLRRISEMLSVAYMAKKKYLQAVKEYASLGETSQNDQQKAGYRDRIREIIDKDLSADDLRTLAAQKAYPADLAQLRLASMLIEQHQYRDAIAAAKAFLDRYPSHPEKTRAQMLLNDATAKLSSPQYYLGVLVPQSGQLSFFGDRLLRGVQLAVYEYNQKNPESRVELLVKDTEGSPEKAVAALKEFASKNVIAAIGPLLTKEAEAIAPELNALKIPVITPAASGEDIGKLSPWLFRNALTNSSQAAAAAQYAIEQRLKKFVIFYPDDAYGKDLARLFTRSLERRAEILASISYPSDVKDFGPFIRRVIEIDLRSRKIPIPDDEAERKKLFENYTPSFDALYLPGYAERVGLLIPQLAFYNIANRAIIGSNNWDSPDLIERAQRHAEGAVFFDGFFSESIDPAVKAVIDAYRSAYGEELGFLAAQSYDAAAMVLSLLKEHKDTPLAIKEGLQSLRNFPGISGETSFAGTGEAQKKLFLIKIEDGKFVLSSAGK